MPVCMILGMCYDNLFPGLPVMRLRGYQYFLWSHEAHRPPVVDLQDFSDHFDDVLAMFRNHNYPAEYATRYAADPAAFPDHAPPRPENATPLCEARLRAFRNTILHLGADTVYAEIARLMNLFASAPSAQFDFALNNFLLHNHDPTVLPPTHGGAQLQISHLLTRMQDM